MDQYHDTCHQELVKIAKDHSLPNYALEKDLGAEDLTKLSSHDFAFPEARYFPIHTKEDTLLSSAFFLKKQAEFGDYREAIHARLSAACHAHGISEDFENLSSFEKKASAKEYLLPELKKFPVNTPEELVKASEWLQKQKDIIPPELYRRMSSDLDKRGYDLNARPNPEPCNSLDIEKAASLMVHRAKKTNNPLLKEAMLKFTKALMLTQEDGSHDQELIEKLAEFVDRFDKVSGVNKRGSYGRGRNVVASQESSFVKQAAASLTLDGKVYGPESLEKISVDQLRNGLGSGFVDAVTREDGALDLEKFAEIAETLPLPDKKILAMYLPE
jgi:hypothetical protein